MTSTVWEKSTIFRTDIGCALNRASCVVDSALGIHSKWLETSSGQITLYLRLPASQEMDCDSGCRFVTTRPQADVAVLKFSSTTRMEAILRAAFTWSQLEGSSLSWNQRRACHVHEWLCGIWRNEIRPCFCETALCSGCLISRFIGRQKSEDREYSWARRLTLWQVKTTAFYLSVQSKLTSYFQIISGR